MQLNVDDQRHIESPDSETVRAAITGLGPNQFIVLSIDDGHYIQVYHHDDGTWQLEYREGTADDHYGTDPGETTIDDVLNAFDAFLQQTDDWYSPWQWEKVDLSELDDEEE